MFQQRPEYIVTTVWLGVVAAFLGYWVMRFLAWIGSGLVDWLFLDDAPAPAHAPEPTEPSGAVETAITNTGDYITHIAQQWAQSHAFGDIDSAMVPIMWLLAGLVFALVGLATRGGTMLFAAWSVPTVWVVYAATPGDNPAPAALAAVCLALAICVMQLVKAVGRVLVPSTR